MKKIFKYTLLALAGVAMASLSSCNKDEAFDYVPGEASGMQVYFSNEVSNNVNVTDNDTQFSLPVMRQNTDEAVTIPVEITFSQGAETRWIPKAKSVSFAEGQEKAELVFTFDPTKIEYDTPDTVNVKISDPKYISAYGAAEGTYILTKPAPWTPWISTLEDWKAAGYDAKDWPLSEKNNTCTYVYTQYWDESDPGLPIAYRMSLKDPDQAEFKVKNWGSFGIDLIIGYNPLNGKCTVGAHRALYSSKYEEDVIMSDVSTWQGKDFSAQFPCTYDPERGLFKLNVAYYISLGSFAYGEEYIQVDGFPDYTVDIAFKGRLIDAKEKGSAVFDITLGADVAKALYLMADGNDAMPIYEAILAGAEGVQELTESGEVKIGYKEPGDKTLVVVGFDAAGNEVAAVYTTINIPKGGSEEETWTALYVGDYIHRNQSYAQSGKGVWSEGPARLHTGSTLYMSDQDETRFKIAPWIDNELIFTMDGDNQIVVENQNTGVYEEKYDTYICATDLVTSNVLPEANSEYDESQNVFWFELVWHDLDDITAAGGAWGFTEDYFLLTGEANAPANVKMCTPKNAPKLLGKKGQNRMLPNDKKFSAAKPFFGEFALKNAKKLSKNDLKK